MERAHSMRLGLSPSRSPSFRPLPPPSLLGPEGWYESATLSQLDTGGPKGRENYFYTAIEIYIPSSYGWAPTCHSRPGITGSAAVTGSEEGRGPR